MKQYTHRANRKLQSRQLFSYPGKAETVKYNLAPWEADNGSVTSVVWATETGQAAITNEDLTSSVASALIATGQEGRSLVKITLTAGNNIDVTYIHVYARDPKTNYNDLTRSHYY